MPMTIETEMRTDGPLYDLLPIGVMALAKDRQVTVWNQCLENWSGLRRSEVIGRRLGDLFAAYDDSNFSQRLDDVFESGAPVVLSAQFHGQVIPLRLPDGRDRIHQATVTAMLGPDGSRWALFAIQDVTDLALQIQAFRAMREEAIQATNRAETSKQLAERRNEKLAEVNRELEQFAYLASHDLQEPLRTLTSFSTFLRSDLGEDLPENAARDLEHIGSATARMRRLIDDLLALSRVSRSEMSWSKVPLKACVAEAMELLEVRIEECDSKINGTDNLPTVLGDRRLLTQVFQNLLGNAMKFTDASRHSVIDIGAEREEGGWLVSVADNGIGISEPHLEKIFEPFQRLHGADKYPGSGMGLAICKRGVERHGGAVWAKPNTPDGSCFQFTLPDSHGPE